MSDLPEQPGLYSVSGDQPTYVPLREPVAQTQKTCPRWVTTALVLMGILTSALVTFFVTRSTQEKGGHSNLRPGSDYDPERPFRPAAAFQMSLLFTIPYVKLKEPFYAYVDNDQGMMTLSYYSGQDVYYYNAAENGTQKQLLPVYDKQVCFEVPTVGPNNLPPLFPDMAKFSRNGKGSVTPPDGNEAILCDKWSYTGGTPGSKSPSGNSEYIKPDAEGYAGSYDFYVDEKSGLPVAFYMKGHNVAVGGSHLDEYWLHYLSYTVQDTPIDKSIFSPPLGLQCHNANNPLGPTRNELSTDPTSHLVRSDPADDLRMLMPHHVELRSQRFATWTSAHQKTYSSQEEAEFRSNIFHSNLRYVNAANRRGKSYSLAANHLADWTKDELRRLNGRIHADAYSQQSNGRSLADQPDYTGQCTQHVMSTSPLPASRDWRIEGGPQNTGIVQPPKDQGTCGSCWTYGVTGTIEGQMAKKTGVLVDMSEQSIMDCTWAAGNHACAGGMDYAAYGWLLLKNDGQVASAADYGADMNQNGFCHFAINNEDQGVKNPLVVNPLTGKTVTASATIESCFHVGLAWNGTVDGRKDAKALMNEFTDALAHEGPLSIAIDATVHDFYFYNAGLYDDSTCKSGVDDLDHIVLAVGYGTMKNGDRYTIVRNSWSTHWGEEGYIRMSQDSNVCGVATSPTYVHLKNL